MYRLRVLPGFVAMLVLAVPVGMASAGTSEPDDAPTESTQPTATDAQESGPPSASAPDDTTGGSADGQPPENMDFQIDMMLGLIPEEEMQTYWRDQNRASEELVEGCMVEAGFEYVPQPDEMFSYDQYNGRTQLDWAQQFGFGVWTTMSPESSEEAYGQGPMTDWPGDVVNNLSDDEQSAWWGVFDRCQQEGWSNQDDPYSNPMVQQIMEDFAVDVENDPRYRDALAAWQECMAGSGHPFADEQEMWDHVYGGNDEGQMDQQMQFWESEAWLETSPDHAQWQALVDEEIEIAVAHATCTPSLTEARQEVTRDLRDDLVAVWQTIDWSLPPVTYEDVVFGEGTLVEEPSGSDVGESEPAEAAGTGDEPTESTETPVGLDLGGAPTEAPEPTEP